MRALARVCVTLAGNLLAATLISFFPLSPKQILYLPLFTRTSQLCVLVCKSKEPFLISQQLQTILICPFGEELCLKRNCATKNRKKEA